MEKRKSIAANLIKAHWAPWLVKVGKFYDKDEVNGCCFACGFENARLIRAHITARHLGGTDQVENLHLLCRWCHRSSESLTGSVYFLWFHARNMLDVLVHRCIEVGAIRGSDLLKGKDDPKYYRQILDHVNSKRKTKQRYFL